MTPDTVLALLGTLCAGTGGEPPRRTWSWDANPASVDEGIGLSAPVSAAVPEAVRLIEELLRDDEPESPRRGPRPAGPRMRRDGMKKIVIGGAALAALVAARRRGGPSRPQALPADPADVNRWTPPAASARLRRTAYLPAGDGVPGRPARGRAPLMRAGRRPAAEGRRPMHEMSVALAVDRPGGRGRRRGPVTSRRCDRYGSRWANWPVSYPTRSPSASNWPAPEPCWKAPNWSPRRCRGGPAAHPAHTNGPSACRPG